MRPRWSGVAPGRDHGVCNLHQGASGAIGHTRVARPNGSSDEEPAGAPGARSRRALPARAPGARFLPLAFSSLGMKPRR